MLQKASVMHSTAPFSFCSNCPMFAYLCYHSYLYPCLLVQHLSLIMIAFVVWLMCIPSHSQKHKERPVMPIPDNASDTAIVVEGGHTKSDGTLCKKIKTSAVGPPLDQAVSAGCGSSAQCPRKEPFAHKSKELLPAVSITLTCLESVHTYTKAMSKATECSVYNASNDITRVKPGGAHGLT
ncbi:hypothetical protein EDD85DRAFT_979954 [Armillaria nabsnona]|nr:hypothetical protein EDD85DRAFT_979954 [Armillaria nabsnona]